MKTKTFGSLLRATWWSCKAPWSLHDLPAIRSIGLMFWEMPNIIYTLVGAVWCKQLKNKDPKECFLCFALLCLLGFVLESSRCLSSLACFTMSFSLGLFGWTMPVQWSTNFPDALQLRAAMIELRPCTGVTHFNRRHHMTMKYWRAYYHMFDHRSHWSRR